MAKFAADEMLHRVVKEALDSGAASSIAEANQMFRGFQITLEIGPAAIDDRDCQAALLTAVTLARRVFLGGVNVCCPVQTRLAVPLPIGPTLGDAVLRLGGKLGHGTTGQPLVSIGDSPVRRSAAFHIRTAFGGWRGGILPADCSISIQQKSTLPLAPMLAAALAVNEAFTFVRSGSPAAGRRPLGLSLWRPSPDTDWTVPTADEPELSYLPTRLWLLGLGHLGQAFLWGLGLLPYPNPSEVSLVLQDFDIVTPATESTSMLTDAELVGQKKTRTMATWAERRGFTTAIYERLFDASFSRRQDEPAVLLCGVDNGLARTALDRVGFDLVIEAGLGRGHRDYRTMRIHSLPGPRPAAAIWNLPNEQEEPQIRAAYQKLLDDGDLDRCGVTLLAGKAVGAPFVGAVAACLVLSELLRLLHGGQLHEVIDIDLEALDYRTALRHPHGFGHFNPGYLRVNG
jgi:hypothetical protein